MNLKNTTYSSKKSGFSLVELIIVMLITGILAAITIPNMGDSKIMGISTEAEAVLSALTNAAIRYHSEKGHFNEMTVQTLIDDFHVDIGTTANWTFTMGDGVSVGNGTGETLSTNTCSFVATDVFEGQKYHILVNYNYNNTPHENRFYDF
jgi:prepilin-type N-terminal cleavage/methylation domain-containing protein